MASCLVYILRTVIPLMFGFVIGSLLSLAIFPSIQHHSVETDLLNLNCEGEHSQQERDTAKESFVLPEELDNQAERHIEKAQAQTTPIIQQMNKVTKLNKTQSLARKPKLIRPRFYATEFGIKDKLFVGVLTTKQTVNTMAVAANRTISHHVNKIIFFVEGPHSESLDQGPLNLIGFAHMKPHLKALYVLEYISKHLINNYDWFFLVPDSTYVKGFKLYELATHMSIGHSILMGKKLAQNPTLCDFQAGILVSQDVMKKATSQVIECRNQADPDQDVSQNLGKCIYMASKAICVEEWNGKSFKTWEVTADEPIHTSFGTLSKKDAFNSAISVYQLTDPMDFHYLHKHYCTLELEQISSLTVSIQNGIHNLSLETSDGPTWPAGLTKPWKPKNRFEVFQWDFFTTSHIFPNQATDNVRELSGSHKKDVDKIIEFGQNYINAKYPDYTFKRFLNGYKKFDPTRGMDYILDMVYEKPDDPLQSSVYKRIHIVKPLSRVELIAMPYVTESTEVTIVMPVTKMDLEAARRFIARFGQTCIHSGDNSRLIVAFVQENIVPTRVITGFELLQKDISVTLDQFSDDQRGQPAIESVQIHDFSTVTQTDVVDAVMDHIGSESLILLLSPWVELHVDFLNRVRMNTIRGVQVFFPIPFNQFHPDIVQRTTTLKTSSARPPADTNAERRKRSAVWNDRSPSSQPFEVHKNYGMFDHNDYTIASFYGVDYARHKERLESSDLSMCSDVAQVFLSATDVHLLRAVDPLLKVRYHEKLCPPQLQEIDYALCLISRRTGLASKAQLATMILQQEGNLASGK